MPKWAVRLAIWGPLLIAAALVVAYVLVHRPFAFDSTELSQVPLSEGDSTLDQVGDLQYLGGLDIPRMGQNIGGLSGLRWDAESERLLAITDDARWVWLSLEEEAGRLTGIAAVEAGDLLGPNGEVLTGKEAGDSEALLRDEEGTWGVAFERDHRILVFHNGLSEPSVRTLFEPEERLGEMEDNSGIEALAIGNRSQLICAQRRALPDQANCQFYSYDEDTYSDFPVYPPQAIAGLGAVPTDADVLADGTYVVLFRSYSPADGNSAAIVTYSPDGARREVATLQPPMTVDNFEGLAVREEDDRTFVYIVSDDNFSGNQRTLLMKFEVLPQAE